MLIITDTSTLCWQIDAADSGRELKYILKGPINLSGSMVKEIKNHGGLLLDGKPVYTNIKVVEGNIVTILLNCCNEPTEIEAENIPLSILYEDDALIIIDKPSNMVVHPAGEHFGDSLANGLICHYNKKGISTKVRPVSRLDKDTTGIIIFARNRFVQEQLTLQSKAGIFKKFYCGIVSPAPLDDKGTISMPISRKPDSIIERHIDVNGDSAITHYNVIKRWSDFALVEFRLETGRTHQIRVHCLYSGFPLVGDTLYNPTQTDLIGRQALHACRVNFTHPVTHEHIEIESSLPEDMSKIIY